MYLFCDVDGVLIPFPDTDGAIPATHHRDHVKPAGQDQPVPIQALAWIDDDFAAADHDWAHARTALGYPTLLIQPDPRQGIQTAHAEAILRWAAVLELPRSA